MAATTTTTASILVAAGEADRAQSKIPPPTGYRFTAPLYRVLPAGRAQMPLAAGASDAVPPEVSNVSPDPALPISRGTVLSFDVTDNVGIAAVWIGATFPRIAKREVVHDGDGFGPGYAGSTKTPITGGFHFEIRRVGGWPRGQSPRLSIEAVDTAGNVLVPAAP